MKKIKHTDIVVWGDITQQKWNYFEDNVYNTYDIIICVNVIHYINDLTKMKSFIENILKMSKKGSQFILIALDSYKMKSIDSDKCCDENFAIKHIENDNFYFKYPWIGKEFTEHIPSLDLFISEMKKNWLETPLSATLIPPISPGAACRPSWKL